MENHRRHSTTIRTGMRNANNLRAYNPLGSECGKTSTCARSTPSHSVTENWSQTLLSQLCLASTYTARWAVAVCRRQLGLLAHRILRAWSFFMTGSYRPTAGIVVPGRWWLLLLLTGAQSSVAYIHMYSHLSIYPSMYLSMYIYKTMYDSSLHSCMFNPFHDKREPGSLLRLLWVQGIKLAIPPAAKNWARCLQLEVSMPSHPMDSGPSRLGHANNTYFTVTKHIHTQSEGTFNRPSRTRAWMSGVGQYGTSIQSASSVMRLI